MIIKNFNGARAGDKQQNSDRLNSKALLMRRLHPLSTPRYLTDGDVVISCSCILRLL